MHFFLRESERAPILKVPEVESIELDATSEPLIFKRIRKLTLFRESELTEAFRVVLLESEDYKASSLSILCKIE